MTHPATIAWFASHELRLSWRDWVSMMTAGQRWRQRNVAIFADGEVDRSPTGSATSARTALLVEDGVLVAGRTWRNDSIAGTTFVARAIGEVPAGLLTEVEGTAFRTGEHRFVLDPRDPLGTGFVLR